MPIELALPIASAVALIAVATYAGRPRIRLRTHNQAHGGLRVIEVALILSHTRRADDAIRAGRVRGVMTAAERAPGERPTAEFVIYMTLKTGAR